MKVVIKIKSILFFLLLFGFVGCFVSQTANQEVIERTKQFNTSKKNLAIQGFDPISYFLGNPKKGSATISYTHKEILYYFASEKNRELFKSSPEKFEPAYGGWCAYAMGAKGEKVEIDPETYKIVNGKLYLFYNAVFNNTLPKWNADEKNLNKKADENWQKIVK